jgi:hypothetical protein
MDRLKLPATTIVETITAALLVMISLGIGMMIYMNVLTTEKLVAKIKAQAILSRMAEQTVFDQLFITGHIVEDGITIEKNIEAYDAEYPDAVLMTLTAYVGEKKEILCQLKEIHYPTLPR